jgi:diacylglycerol kinase (ATP)
VLRSDSSENDWVGISANRSSGIGHGTRAVERLAEALEHAGLRSQIAWTAEERAGLVSKSSSDPRCRCLVAVGGDGTVSALLNEWPTVPLSIFPAGTENLLAQHFGLGRDPATLAAMIVAGRPIRVDVGRAQARRFLLMVGFGFDGDVVTRHHQTRLSRAGGIRPTNRLAYVEPILRSSMSYRFPRISVRIDDPGAEETLTGTTVFVFNVPRYALGLPFVPSALDNDGWLDLVVFRNPGPVQALYYLWKVFLGTHLEQPGVFHRQVKKLFVTADESIPVQIDGDPGGHVLAQEKPPQNECPRDDHGLDNLVNRGDDLGHAQASAHHDSSVGWTVEILPAALELIAPADSPMRSNRAALASNPAAH